MNTKIKNELISITKLLYKADFDKIELQPTRREFEGDVTVNVFSLLRFSRKSPEQTATELGEHLQNKIPQIKSFNVVKGFLNIVIDESYYLEFFSANYNNKNFGITKPDSNKIMVEYSSPNTNKPLHLGHVRNNLLGFSVAKIIEASGANVIKTQIINDRGIHICKSMIAWKMFGNGETPETSGLKGDKLVGKYYVLFDKKYKEQIASLIDRGMSENDAKQQATIMLKAKDMLVKWENSEPETMELWNKMNSWVYKGFEVTYKNLGVEFDDVNYESKTYILGKEIVEKGLKENVFYRKDDGSVWVDLTDVGLDEKILLRSDGTSVYMTQDLGTAVERFKKYNLSKLIYTVGNEQDYHFKVLFEILKKLKYSWAENMYHLSYGMVDLPNGKMKSREGTVVDADDLVGEMKSTAKKISEELGKLEGFSDSEKEKLYQTIGMGALKYHILKVDPKKRILFDPETSIDFNGNTGPFIQYTHARIQSIIRKSDSFEMNVKELKISEKEKDIIKHIADLTGIIEVAAKKHSPAIIANYTYDLVKLYNSFYQSTSILGIDDDNLKAFRVNLSAFVANTIKTTMSLLGIDSPSRM